MAHGPGSNNHIELRSDNERQRAPVPRTVTEMILRLASRNDRGPIFLDDKLAPQPRSFADIVRQAKHHGAQLRAHGIAPGEPVALIVSDAQMFLPAFFGAILAGAIPVPMALPTSMRAIASYIDKCKGILLAAGCRTLITQRDMGNALAGQLAAVPSLKQILHVEDVSLDGPSHFEPHQPFPSDTCFLQFTSGSTAAPKGVIVTHENLVANSHCIMHGWMKAGPEDIGASWLPLYHDMGLIGFVIAPLLTATPVVFIPTLAFVRSPSCWMNAINTYRATITVAPNFGLALAAKWAKGVEQLDLRCLRVIGCGAEPINAETLAAFADCYAQGGLGRNVLSPAYGLAEATLLATSHELGTPLRVLEIDRHSYEVDKRAVPSQASDAPAMRLVSCGHPPRLHEVRIMSEDGASELGDGCVGEIWLSGPSCTPGYFGLPAWNGSVATGDLGFVHDGELYISGRKKDMFIVNGRNVYPQSVEWEVEKIPQVRRGSVVAFSVPSARGEVLVVLTECVSTESQNVPEQIKQHIAANLSLPVHNVTVVAKGLIPKTSSGKVRRSAARDWWLQQQQTS